MPRIGPIAYMYILILSILGFFLLKGVEIAELVVIPHLAYQAYGLALAALFFWWPLDLILNWEKRTLASMEKDKYIFGAAVAVIVYVGMRYFAEMSFEQSLSASVGLGVIYPASVLIRRWLAAHRIEMNPEHVHLIGSQSPRAKEFLQRFPQAGRYVIGLNEADGARAHLLLHHREDFHDAQGFQVDYVMDIPVERQAKLYVGGKERLHCYLFTNREGKARIGFLPSMNIGRALDYGFSDEEVDRALEEAENPEQNWAALDEKPLIVRYYPGRAIRVG